MTSNNIKLLPFVTYLFLFLHRFNFSLISFSLFFATNVMHVRLFFLCYLLLLLLKMCIATRCPTTCGSLLSRRFCSFTLSNDPLPVVVVVVIVSHQSVHCCCCCCFCPLLLLLLLLPSIIACSRARPFSLTVSHILCVGFYPCYSCAPHFSIE